MAAARQYEIKVSITVVATKTLMAGRCRFSAVVDIGVFEVPLLRVGGEQHSAREYQCTAFTSGLSQMGQSAAVWRTLLSFRQVRSADAVVPAERIDVHKGPEQAHH